jgi:hypothetical protein
VVWETIEKMIKSYSYGHQIEYVNNQWRCTDNKEILDLKNPRSCKKCGKSPTPKGYDSCLGYVENAIAVCCGHGIKEGYIQY